MTDSIDTSEREAEDPGPGLLARDPEVRQAQEAPNAGYSALLQPLTDDELPALPETSYLGDDASWGYDASDMRDHANRAAEAQRLKSEQELAKCEPYDYIYETDGPFGRHRSLDSGPYNGRNPDRSVPVYRIPPNAAARIAELEARCAELTRVLTGMVETFQGVPEVAQNAFDEPPEPKSQWDYEAFLVLNEGRRALETKHEQG